VERIPAPAPVAPGLQTAVARLDGPVLVSRGGQAEAKPWPGAVLVAFGRGALPPRGAFDVTLPSGLALQGFAVGGGEVVNLRGVLAGRPLELPSWALLFVSEDLRSVAGGPADPGAWDRWFGELSSVAEGEGEARARAHKASALQPGLAALYAEVRRMREAGAGDRERLLAIRAAGAQYPGDWLLEAEVDELLGGDSATGRAELQPDAPAR
jgi:phenylalanine-4-hydroxylase